MQAQEDIVMVIKGNRSKRPRLSLTMTTTSSSTAEISTGGFSGGVTSDAVSGDSHTNSGDLEHSTLVEEEYMANCLILLAKGSLKTPDNMAPPPSAAGAEVYQCKTCDKSFSSFQALGGHRASHKKINKQISAVEIKRTLMRENKYFQSNGRDDCATLSLQPSNKSRVHECSICRAEFGSGQALGGHMRRHRPIPAPTPPPRSGHGESEELKRPRNILSLDLNLPAPEDDHGESNKFPFASKEQIIVFSASPLIDCHY